jgi:hypothetical protein
MTSLLSFLGDGISGLDMYMSLYNNEDLIKLINYNKDKDPQTIATLFLKNTIHKVFDEYADEIIDNKEMESIFSDKKKDDETKLKLYIFRAVMFYYHKYLKHFIDGEQLMIISTISEFIILSIDKNKSYDSGKNIYLNLVDSITSGYIGIILPLLNSFLGHNLDNSDYKELLGVVANILKEVNLLLEYESKYCIDDKIVDNPSDSDNTDNLDKPDNTKNDDNNDDTTTGKKRPRDSQNNSDDNSDNNLEDNRDPKKPKK